MDAVRLQGRTIVAGLLVLVTSGTTACFGRHTLQPPAADVAAASPIRLAVDNRHWADVRIYVVHDGTTTRLGLVPAASSARFPVPSYLVGQSGEIRLIADPVAAFRKITTDVIVVKPGQEVVWTLEYALGQSTVAVY